MSEILKQSIIIENRSGQGGVAGTDAVAKSPPDGYTIAITSAGALAISPSMEKVSYETLKDLQPITLASAGDAGGGYQCACQQHEGAGRAGELTQPGSSTCVVRSRQLPHLAGELFKLTAKINIAHVPYRGAAPAVNDLLTSRCRWSFSTCRSALQIKAGVKPIAVGAPQRAERA
jgi:tripartite-type tricarboxylate transporter receptor subunit TctC